MSPTSSVYHSRPADLIVGRISVGLENAFELTQEPLRSVPSATQAEVEHHGSSGVTVLPEIRLVILSSAFAFLHTDRGFIGLLLARQMFPGGVVVDARNREEAIRATRELLVRPPTKMFPPKPAELLRRPAFANRARTEACSTTRHVQQAI
jgi:hypothetical protein